MAWWRFRATLPDARRWGLAAGGLLTHLNDEGFDRLQCRQGAAASRQCLAQGWGVHDPNDLMRILRWLWQEGHRTGCAVFIAELRHPGGPPAAPGDDAEADARAFLEQHLAELGPSALVGWDLGRLVQVARWGFTAGYLVEEEAWHWIMQAARTLQCSFDSWAALGHDFMLGFEFWRRGTGVPPGLDLKPFYQWLRRDPQSPWRRLRWTTDLSA